MIVKLNNSELIAKDFTLGNQYTVLSILVRNHAIESQNIETLIIIRRDSDGTPCLILLTSFEILDPSIPMGWVFNSFPDNVGYSIEPIEFTGDFWDKYYDGDENAEKTFESVWNRLTNF